jgi:hypothetical protein
VSFLTVGCASSTVQFVKPTAPPNLKQECPELDELKGNTLGDLTEFTVKVIGTYADCRAKHSNLVKVTE